MFVYKVFLVTIYVTFSVTEAAVVGARMSLFCLFFLHTAFLHNCHIRWYEATDRWTHADDARTPTHDASSSTDDDASQARHDATRQIRASGFPPLCIAINPLSEHFGFSAEIVSM